MEEKYMEEISLRELIEVVWKGKWIIAIITIVAVLLTGVGTYLMIPNSQRVVAIIELNYPGIELGQNPDGTKFDIRQLKSPYVIENALKTLGFNDNGVKLDQVRRNIDITSIIPNDVSQRAETMIKQGHEYVYYPSEFKVTYRINKDFSYNQGLQLVETIIDEYQTYFYTLYSDIEKIEKTIGTLDYSTYDYPDIVEVINIQIEGIQEFLTNKTEDDSNYKSAQTGYSFQDLNRNFDILRTVDTSKLESLVNAYTLTRDKEKLIKDYEYRVKRMELEQAKKNSEAEEARRLMDQYKKEDLVLIPDSIGKDLRTDNPESYYNKLAETAITASVEATNLKHEIEYYNKEIARLQVLNGSNNIALLAEADSQIETIKNKMVDLIDTTNETLNDYYAYKYGGSIKQIAPAELVNDMNILLNLAIAFVLGLMVSVFVVFMRFYWKSTEKEVVPEEV